MCDTQLCTFGGGELSWWAGCGVSCTVSGGVAAKGGVTWSTCVSLLVDVSTVIL